MNAACSGFMFGLVTASQFIQSGQYRNILLICAEKMTMVVDPQDLKTFPLFGDGAAAVLISQALEGDSPAPSGILAYALGSQGELGHTLMVPCGGSRYPATVERLADRSQFLKMEGRTVFKWAVRLIPDVIEHLLQDAQLRREDIDLFVFHQANRRIIDAATEAAGLDPNRVFVNVDRYGNTSAASIPICLHEAAAQGLIRPGSKIFMAGFGSGLTWGGCIFQW
jgi:3-oxoacyl-[acyl-carrier-protein] synthase-3